MKAVNEGLPGDEYAVFAQVFQNAVPNIILIGVVFALIIAAQLLYDGWLRSSARRKKELGKSKTVKKNPPLPTANDFLGAYRETLLQAPKWFSQRKTFSSRVKTLADNWDTLSAVKKDKLLTLVKDDLRLVFRSYSYEGFGVKRSLVEQPREQIAFRKDVKLLLKALDEELSFCSEHRKNEKLYTQLLLRSKYGESKTDLTLD